MFRSDLSRTAVPGFVALVIAVGGCGKGDNSATVDTGSRAEASSTVRVADVKVGRGLGADKRLTDPTDEFRPTDVIYVVVETRGSDPNASLQARWTYEDGQVVDETSRDISAAGQDVTEFHISKPDGWPTGKYKVEILLNGASTATEDFEVK